MTEGLRLRFASWPQARVLATRIAADHDARLREAGAVRSTARRYSLFQSIIELAVDLRARSVLELAADRLSTISWVAWELGGAALDVGEVERVEVDPQLVARVETLALGRPYYDDGIYWGGPARSSADPRLRDIEHLRRAVGLSAEAVDARVVELHRRHDGRLVRFMTKLRGAVAGVEHAQRGDLPITDVVDDGDGLADMLGAEAADTADADLDNGVDAIYEQADRETVRKVLSAVARVDGRLDAGAVIDLLLGSRADELERLGLDRSRTFGALSASPRAWVESVLATCSVSGLVESERLTALGRAVMRGEVDPPFRVPEPELPSQEWELA